MARGEKLSKDAGAKKPRISELMEAILEDVIKAGKMPSAEWRALSSSPFVPLAIPLTEGGHYPVTQVGVNAAHELTRQTWVTREDLRQTIERSVFDKLSFQALGETIRTSPGHLPQEAKQEQVHAPLGDEFYSALAADYLDNLDRLADRSRPDVDRHIPCHLFHADQLVQAFAVGPVMFRPREIWLDNFVTNSKERELIREVEVGDKNLDVLLSERMVPDSDQCASTALNVLRSLRNYSWVATVRMEGHELTQSHLKASIIIGLAIDVIGLLFHVQDARRFAKAGRQHMYGEDRLATSLDGRFMRGFSVQMPGLGGRPGDMASKIKNDSHFLEAAGCILQHYVDGRRKGKALHLVERWANALYWVGEARREASDFMAVINYGCAVDGLSGAGGTAKEMIILAEAALKSGEDPTSEGMSIEDAVTKVYLEGRNKLAHGEMSGLLEDLSEIRDIGEFLLSALFETVTPVLADLLRSEPNITKIAEKHAYRLLRIKLQNASEQRKEDVQEDPGSDTTGESEMEKG
ncbi:hypothetical protein ABQZ69_10430 [Xanthomonas sp. WHRI 8391]|uniref:hypothetical protein n=1 Tax=Xanthomonas sp. WHRI 8391 TaxID=3161573 RepID=UPI0032E882D0